MKGVGGKGTAGKGKRTEQGINLKNAFLPGTDGRTDADWQSLYIFTKNARINSDERLEMLLAELHEIEWHIILFSEAHAVDDDCRL